MRNSSRRFTAPSIDRKCIDCGAQIAESKRADTAYCSPRCVANAAKRRYKARNPEYVKRQLLQVQRIKHLKVHGHTRYIDNPIGNPKDRFRVARSLGYRSMLEWNIAQQLIAAGIDARACYESMIIRYHRV